jgi:rare lipoprotein A
MSRSRLAAFTALAAAILVTGCAAPVSDVKIVPAKRNTKTLEYFSEATVGVKASPRVAMNGYDTTTKDVALVPIPKPIGASAPGAQIYALQPPAKSLRRGGGRDQIGRAYKVRGKWYTPKDQPGYSREGRASWYGDAFHGRLTANGEVYDMNHLTAAHPTLPLPSYARVTNTANGRSVIVRINDRGPYAEGRVIDLSKRVAHVLDTKHEGVGRVRVDYIGRAPVDGRDDAFLLASFRQNDTGSRAEDMRMYAAFTDGRQNEPTMLAALKAARPLAPMAVGTTAGLAANPVDGAFPEFPPAAEASPGMALAPLGFDAAVTMDGTPLPQSRPYLQGADPFADPALQLRPGAPLGYAPLSEPAADRFGAILAEPASRAATGWTKRLEGKPAPVEIMVGSLPAGAGESETNTALAMFGETVFAPDGDGRRQVTLKVDPARADEVLKALWAMGYRDAFEIR